MEQPVTRASLGEDARCVASAARDLVRAIQNVGDVEEAVDALEACARRAVDATVHGFDAGEAGEPDPEDMLGVALTQLEIGNTLLAAQHALTAPGKALRLDSAATSLEDAADVTDFLGAAAPGSHGFDAAGAAVMSVPDTAFAAAREPHPAWKSCAAETRWMPSAADRSRSEGLHCSRPKMIRRAAQPWTG